MAPSTSAHSKAHLLWVIAVPLLFLGSGFYWILGRVLPFWHYLLFAAGCALVYFWLSYIQNHPSNPGRDRLFQIWTLLGAVGLSFLSYPDIFAQAIFLLNLLLHLALAWFLQLHLRSRAKLLKKIQYISDPQLRALLHNEDPSLGYTPERHGQILRVLGVVFAFSLVSFWFVRPVRHTVILSDALLLGVVILAFLFLLGRFNFYLNEMKIMKEGLRETGRSRRSLLVSQLLVLGISGLLALQGLNWLEPTSGVNLFQYREIVYQSTPEVRTPEPQLPVPSPTEEGLSESIPNPILLFFLSALNQLFKVLDILMGVVINFIPWALGGLLLYPLVVRFLRSRSQIALWLKRIWPRFLQSLRRLLKFSWGKAPDWDSSEISDSTNDPVTRKIRLREARQKEKKRRKNWQQAHQLYLEAQKWMKSHRIPLHDDWTPLQQILSLESYLQPPKDTKNLSFLAQGINRGLYSMQILTSQEFDQLKLALRDLKASSLHLP